MTLDEGFVPTHELMRRAEADAARRDWQDHLEREELESPDAEMERWRTLFRRMAEERGEVHYDDRPGIDRRLYAVDGDVDREPVERMQHWLGDAS